jgi:hypothetical protein
MKYITCATQNDATVDYKSYKQSIVNV